MKHSTVFLKDKQNWWTLAKLMKKKKKKWEYPNKTKIRGEIKANTTDIENRKRTLQLSANKLDSLENEQISRII